MAFEKLVGNKEIKETLKKQINNKQISHSYMFVGTEGIGKELFAKEFAKAILCLSEKKYCNECDSCNKYNGENHPDFCEIKANGNYIRISQIREMEEDIYQKPIISSKKVFIINDADKMTEEAQNSLLKTLEEPPEYIVIILIVANENSLLNTIKSRCIKIPFSNITEKELTEYIIINKLADNFNKNIIDACNGSIGKAEKIIHNEEQYEKLEGLIHSILEEKKGTIIDVIKKSEILYKSKDEINDLLDYIIVITYNMFKQRASRLDIKQLSEIITIIEKTKVRIQANANFDMSIDNMIIEIYDVIE